MPYQRIPSLNWLRVFETAARFESFARAAEVLNMSAPAVSQQIRALEGYLGRPLFERGPRSVRLTEAGRSFLPTVSRALAEVEVAAAGLFGAPDAASLSLRVSLLFSVGWLAPRLPAFEAAHPTVRLAMQSAIYDEFPVRDVDLQITFGRAPGLGEDGATLFGERLTPVAPPERAARIDAPSDLLAAPLIEISTHRANWLHLLAELGLEPSDRLNLRYVDNTVAAFALAAAGGGVALARAPASDALSAHHGLVPCLPEVDFPGFQDYYLIWPASGRLSPAARAFKDWLLRAVGEDRP